MASRKAPTCRVHINVRARRRSVVNFMPGRVIPYHGLGRAPVPLFLRRLRVGLRGRDSWRPGSQRAEGRESGEAEVLRATRTGRGLFLGGLRVVDVGGPGRAGGA